MASNRVGGPTPAEPGKGHDARTQSQQHRKVEKVEKVREVDEVENEGTRKKFQRFMTDEEEEVMPKTPTPFETTFYTASNEGKPSVGSILSGSALSSSATPSPQLGDVEDTIVLSPSYTQPPSVASPPPPTPTAEEGGEESNVPLPRSNRFWNGVDSPPDQAPPQTQLQETPQSSMRQAPWKGEKPGEKKEAAQAHRGQPATRRGEATPSKAPAKTESLFGPPGKPVGKEVSPKDKKRPALPEEEPRAPSFGAKPSKKEAPSRPPFIDEKRFAVPKETAFPIEGRPGKETARKGGPRKEEEEELPTSRYIEPEEEKKPVSPFAMPEKEKRAAMPPAREAKKGEQERVPTSREREQRESKGPMAGPHEKEWKSEGRRPAAGPFEKEAKGEGRRPAAGPFEKQAKDEERRPLAGPFEKEAKGQERRPAAGPFEKETKKEEKYSTPDAYQGAAMPTPIRSEDREGGQGGREKKSRAIEIEGPSLPHLPANIIPIATAAAQQANPYLSPQTLPLFYQMVGTIYVMTTPPGVSRTEIVLNAPSFANSRFYGSTITIEKYSTAPDSLNIRLTGTNEAVNTFNQNIPNLYAAFQNGNFAFRIGRIDAEYSAERPVFRRKEGEAKKQSGGGEFGERRK